MNDRQLAMLKMQEEVAAHLKECCQELLSWYETGVLHVGRVRGIAEMLIPVDPQDKGRRVKLVEYEVKQQAMAFVVRA